MKQKKTIRIVITSYSIHYTKLYDVEDTRVGQVTDFDKLTFEVWTDGSIEPDETVSLGAKILSDVITSYSIHYTKLYDSNIAFDISIYIDNLRLITMNFH